jgi:hypothetical protein
LTSSGIELRSEVVHQRLDFLYISGRKKVSFECAPEEVLRFVQRSPRGFHKAPIVLEIVTARSFGDVRTDAVGTPYDLPANCVPSKRVPAVNDFPNLVCQFFSQLVNPQILEICPAHNLWYYCVRPFQAADY